MLDRMGADGLCLHFKAL